MKAKPKLPSQIVGNVGMYYVCFRLSELGLNVMPTARNAKGIDIVAYRADGKGFLGIQVKSFSKRSAIPLGACLDNVMGNVWCVVVRQKDGCLATYVLTPQQIKDGAHQDGNGWWWVEPKKYELPECRDNWKFVLKAAARAAKT